MASLEIENTFVRFLINPWFCFNNEEKGNNSGE